MKGPPWILIVRATQSRFLSELEGVGSIILCTCAEVDSLFRKMLDSGC